MTLENLGTWMRSRRCRVNIRCLKNKEFVVNVSRRGDGIVYTVRGTDLPANLLKMVDDVNRLLKMEPDT